MFRNALAASALLIGLFGTADASLITYNFSGTLNDPFGSLSAGTLFSGSFSYEGSQPANFNYGYTNLSVTFGSNTVTDADTGVINVYDHRPDGSGYPTDLFHLYTFSVSGEFGGLTLEPRAGLQVVLQDLSGSVFDSPSLPGANLSINDFSFGNPTFLELRQKHPDAGFSQVTARGALSYLSATPAVPEPASYVLVISGLGVLASIKVFHRRQ